MSILKFIARAFDNLYVQRIAEDTKPLLYILYGPSLNPLINGALLNYVSSWELYFTYFTLCLEFNEVSVPYRIVLYFQKQNVLCALSLIKTKFGFVIGDTMRSSLWTFITKKLVCNNLSSRPFFSILVLLIAKLSQNYYMLSITKNGNGYTILLLLTISSF